MIPSLEGWPTKAKEAPSPHEVRLAPLDTNPVFHSLGENSVLSFQLVKSKLSVNVKKMELVIFRSRRFDKKIDSSFKFKLDSKILVSTKSVNYLGYYLMSIYIGMSNKNEAKPCYMYS